MYDALVRRSAFTLLEILVTISVIAALSFLSLSLSRRLLIRGDVQRSGEQAVQALARAQALARNGQGDAPWGYHVPTGTLFKGSTFAVRDPAFDEQYPVPSSITASGSLTEVTYSPLEGRPSATGNILLIGTEGEQQSILITVSEEGIPVMGLDRLVICHCQSKKADTLRIPDNAWPAHRDHGDTMGACEEQENPCG